VPEIVAVHEQVVVPVQDWLTVRPDTVCVLSSTLQDPPTHDAGIVNMLVPFSVALNENDPSAPNVKLPETFVDVAPIMAPVHPGKAACDPAQFAA
jgi:hypothetical protein